MSTTTDLHVKTQYDAAYYLDNNQSTDRIANYFFSDILKKYFKGGKIFEYGCGSGFFIQKFGSEKYERLAHDISEYAMQQTLDNNPDILLIRDPSKEIKNRTLDAIAALHVLEHIAEPAGTLRLFQKKLAAGGILFFTVPNMSSVGRRMKQENWFGYRDKTHISLLYPKDWYKLVEDAGFEILSRGSDGLWDVPYIKFIPGIIQKLFFYPTSAVQILVKHTFLPIALGENLVIVARKM